ncbi:MAG: LCP family protein [Candidatus Sericytochromatia bacterium]|nr:LCP family protein [Candidatus Sericytochromatia bacterium]
MGPQRLRGHYDESPSRTTPLGRKTTRLKSEGAGRGPTGPGYQTGQLRLPPSRRRKVSRLKRAVRAGVFLTFCLSLLGALGYASASMLMDGFNTERKRQPTAAEIAKGLVPTAARRAILVLGTDLNYGEGYKTSAGPVRSDTILVLGVGPAGKHLDIVSIPRDTRVLVRGRWDKVNAAFHVGGPKLASDVVSKLLGIPIQHWAQVNTTGLEKLVDVVGGVKLYIDRDMHYVDRTAGLRIDFQRGWHRLNGADAHRYVRFRHDGLGDIGRVQRQQQFMQAVTDQVLSPDTLLRVPRMLHTIKSNVKTNMTGPELVQLATWGASLERSDVRMVMLPGTFSGAQYKGSYWLANGTRARQLGHRLMGLEPAVDAKRATRRQRTVTVLNGTSRAGLAHTAARELREAGWSVRAVGDASLRTLSRTRVISQTGHSQLAGMVGKDLGVSPDRVNASVGDITTDFTVLVGEDYAGELGLAARP